MKFTPYGGVECGMKVESSVIKSFSNSIYRRKRL